MAITFLAFIFTCIFNKEIFELFVSLKFRSAAHLLPWMLLSGGMFAGGQLMSLQLMSDMRPRLMTQVKIVTALLGVSLNLIGAYFYGMLGVVIALLGFSVIYFVWIAFIIYFLDYKNIMHVNVNIKS